MKQTLSASEQAANRHNASIIVDRLVVARTAATYGITGPELNRLSGAVRFMERHCPRGGGLWWLSTNHSATRTIIADIWKRVTRLQGNFGLPRYSALAFECSGGIHAHVIFVATQELAEQLRRSQLFGTFVDVDPVTDANGLVRKYLAKERTPQAGYGRSPMLGGRIRGSHPLQGDGDRVRLSRELERDAVEAAYVEPWQHSNAKRSTERKAYRPRVLRRSAVRLAGQISLLPELEQPVSRLRQFAGGFIPPPVAFEIEFRRKQLGLSQRELAKLIGRSQGQLANALRGHDPISRTAVNRLREILLSARVPLVTVVRTVKR